MPLSGCTRVPSSERLDGAAHGNSSGVGYERANHSWLPGSVAGAAFIVCLAGLVIALVEQHLAGAVLFAVFCCADGFFFLAARRRRLRSASAAEGRGV
jgi:predicted membrane metal-binding protein